MENFKEIAEKCLAGELSGTFITTRGDHLNSHDIVRNINDERTIFPYKLAIYYITKEGNLYYKTVKNKNVHIECIINFISDKMVQKKIKIDIPEGKVPVMEQTEKGVVITWKEKELTYPELLNEFRNNLNCIHTSFVNSASQAFYKKVEVLRKLTNIRNYFGKPDKKNSDSGWIICINGTVYRAIVEQNSHIPVFAEKEHAEQAIKMLGDELKYLFEPW